ncbi:hypothetical protein [Pantoea sp. BAV 3049]|uniref:hypothetical protein n=1 Tax=Pantoea sp. BAV 3049 TaxID=2654188 RepID=UPI00131E6D96|nr:hypothetical protein [Pantoea sp. BAV 3049]
MLIFPGAAEKKQDEETSSVVISPRREVIDEVCAQLEVRNLGPIVRHQISLDQFDTATIEGGIKYLIFDSGTAEECEGFINKIGFFLSKESVCIAIGSSDSLLLAARYQAQGISYVYYHPEQMKKLGKIFDDPATRVEWGKSSLKICILACKGGVGSSSLSYQLASSLIQQRSVSLLLVQGQGGTRNLDLIARKEISSDVTQLKENLFALTEQSEHLWNFSLPLYDTYDFVLFDHTIFNVGSVEIENALQHSHSVVLVCNHDLASIRNAKKIIDYNQHLKNSGSGVKRIIVCFNQNQPRANGMINREEVGNLLGQQADIVIPFIRGPGEPSMPLQFTGKHKAVLQNLTDMTLGRSRRETSAISLRTRLLGLAGRRT